MTIQEDRTRDSENGSVHHFLHDIADLVLSFQNGRNLVML